MYAIRALYDFPPKRKKRKPNVVKLLEMERESYTSCVQKEANNSRNIYTYYYHMYFVCIYALYDTEE